MALPFLDREDELSRLNRLSRSASGGFAVLHGRRRLGKTRLLLEWARHHGGLYITADLSSPEVQRRVVAEAVAARFAGFAETSYPDWVSLLKRLSREAHQAGWRGPIIFDELPYLVQASPELPSVLQRWIDHEAAEAKLVVAVAGSSQRMMQGIVLSSEAPLFGRASVMLEIRPLPAPWLAKVFPAASPAELLEHYAAWGTVCRYLELAAEAPGSVEGKIDHLVLDPLGPLHQEPDRLLIDDIPSAGEVRPVLDAIGMGAHRLSEIASRAGCPATSAARPLKRLLDMGLVCREIPFGESERHTKVSLYRISDPLLRLWFRVVAPHQALLASAPAQARLSLLRRHQDGLRAEAFEELCRTRWPLCASRTTAGKSGPFGPASRWWHGNASEWDLVSASLDDKTVLLGLAHYAQRPVEAARLARLVKDIRQHPAPDFPRRYKESQQVRALFVPALASGVCVPPDIILVTAADMLAE